MLTPEQFARLAQDVQRGVEEGGSGEVLLGMLSTFQSELTAHLTDGYIAKQRARNAENELRELLGTVIARLEARRIELRNDKEAPLLTEEMKVLTALLESLLRELRPDLPTPPLR